MSTTIIFTPSTCAVVLVLAMADQQPTGVEEGDIPLTASYPPPPSTGQDAPDGGAQQEKTAHSDSDSDLFLSTELSKPPSGENGTVDFNCF